MATSQVEIKREERPERASASPVSWVRSPFPPISDYAFLSDCERSVLVSPGGAVEWLCIPRHDSPSIFGALLDRDAGHFSLRPTAVEVPLHREYTPGTLVLETTWHSPGGWVVVRDALVLLSWLETKTRAARYRRTPSDVEAAGMLVRTVRCLRGVVEMSLECSPMFDYARTPASWVYDGPGYSRATAQGGGQSISLVSDFRLGLARGDASGRSILHEGHGRFAAIAWGAESPMPQTFEEAEDRIAQTISCWQLWLDRGHFPDHPWREHLQRSAVVIKGLSYAPTGAVIAAATTSLPETPKGRRNWDYRYSWIRDSTFTLGTLQVLGFEAEAADYHAFVEDAVGEGTGLQIMYGIGGEKRLDEQILEHLTGYEGARPVRIGNGAYSQHQHDVWGMAIGSLWERWRFGTHLPERPWIAVKRLVEDMAAHWREPDQGIWEVRGEPRHFTSSKTACWTGAHLASKLAIIRGDADLARDWGALAHEIREDICKNAVDSRGVFTQYYGGHTLDASNLLMPLIGFLPTDDPRIRATVEATADELTVDGLVLRYRVDATDDGLSGEEGTFTICSFWLVAALAAIGEVGRARMLCEKLLTFASPLGLYAEEIDARTSRHLGNFPQAFSHLALIDAVLRIIDAEKVEGAGVLESVGRRAVRGQVE